MEGGGAGRNPHRRRNPRHPARRGRSRRKGDGGRLPLFGRPLLGRSWPSRMRSGHDLMTPICPPGYTCKFAPPKHHHYYAHWWDGPWGIVAVLVAIVALTILLITL